MFQNRWSPIKLDRMDNHRPWPMAPSPYQRIRRLGPALRSWHLRQQVKTTMLRISRRMLRSSRNATSVITCQSPWKIPPMEMWFYPREVSGTVLLTVPQTGPTSTGSMQARNGAMTFQRRWEPMRSRESMRMSLKLVKLPEHSRLFRELWQ